MIYLDSAATSYYRPKEVAQAVYDAIRLWETQDGALMKQRSFLPG